MKIKKNTVLISGGSAGIGFEIARQLYEHGNEVIITGRNHKRLKAAAEKIGNITAIRCDVTNARDIKNLVEKLNKKHKGLNMLINCAGSGTPFSLLDGGKAWKIAAAEIDTNYLAIIRLIQKLMPQLLSQSESAIVNVSSIAALAPNIKIPTYSASKAAVHSYTIGLRLALAQSVVKVFELMPPLVNTEFSAGIGGKENGISPADVATELVNALMADEYEIHVGKTEKIYELARTSPEEALHAVNGIQIPA